MPLFKNPSSPAQPQKGVYGWYAQKDGQETITIYIGMAGQKESLSPKGTLFRGISELQRNTFTSNSPDYDKLDTDFIVGTAIIYFERKGYLCVWEHISNQPIDELRYVTQRKPILQNVNNANIRDEFRIRKDKNGYWKARKTPEGVSEAEKAIFTVLDKTMAEASPIKEQNGMTGANN